MEKFKIRKNAYVQGWKIGFVVGVLATVATALTTKHVKETYTDHRYPFSHPS